MAFISEELGNIYYGNQCSPEDVEIPDAPGQFYKWNSIEWVYDAEAARAATVPNIVTMRQARLQLLAIEKLDDVEDTINTMGTAARIDWEYAATVERGFPLVVAMQQLFAWNDEQMDEFFISAAKV